MKYILYSVLFLFISFEIAICDELQWPLDCIPGKTCIGDIGYPDIDSDNKAFNCSLPGYAGHHGTDISASKGTEVYAAFDGEVIWAFDGKYDECPSRHPDCQAPPSGWFEADESNGYRICTDLGPYCGTGEGGCVWCFDGGNVIIIKHPNNSKIFATRYDHLKTNSIVVSAGDHVTKGQKIAEVGSAGNSTGPHLHFEVWGTGFYELVDPWAGQCGPNYATPLWENGNTPWMKPEAPVGNNVTPILMLLNLK